jgi:hypothetical protein
MRTRFTHGRRTGLQNQAWTSFWPPLYRHSVRQPAWHGPLPPPENHTLLVSDTDVNPKPIAYMSNCTHASFFKTALMHATHSSSTVRKRIAGLFANTAALKPEELDNSEELVEEDPQTFGKSVAGLHVELGMKILGGCCGTDNRHIDNCGFRNFQLATPARLA